MEIEVLHVNITSIYYLQDIPKVDKSDSQHMTDIHLCMSGSKK